MDPWRTALAQTDATSIRLCGYDITALMRQSSFPATLFLLHRGRLPTNDEARLLDAVLIAVADHGAGAPSCAASRLVASGNRQSLSAAVAAGVLAIGDEHGGAGEACMDADRPRSSSGRAAAASIDRGGARGGRSDPRGRARAARPRSSPAHQGSAGGRPVRWPSNATSPAMASRRCARWKPRATALIKPLPINIDGALAAVLFDLGFPPPAGKLIFIVGRVAG